MLASVCSATLLGVQGRPVRVEVHVSSGLPGFTVVGQPDPTCREARDRVRAALLSSGLSWPNARVTVNLAPPGMRKVGAGLDLAIAAGLLAASEQVRQVTALLLRTWRRDPDLVRVLVREVTRSPHVQQEIEEITEAMKALERRMKVIGLVAAA